MESAIVDALFDFVAAICAMLLLYGGWLGLRYSRGVELYRGSSKESSSGAIAQGKDDREPGRTNRGLPTAGME